MPLSRAHRRKTNDHMIEALALIAAALAAGIGVLAHTLWTIVSSAGWL